MGASSIEIERKTKASLLYVDPSWPVVWSFKSDQDDWESAIAVSPFPTIKAAKRAADGGAANGLYCYVLDRKDVTVYEAVPAAPSPRNKASRKIIKRK